MKSTYIRSLAMIVSCLMVAATAALAQDEASSIIDKLGLTDAQKAQVKDLREKFRTETEKPRAGVRRLSEEEKRLRQQKPSDEVALGKVLHERAELEIELTLALTRFTQQLEGILTPEQKKVLERLRNDHKKQH